MLVAARRCGDQIPIPVLPLLERTNITAQKMLTKDQRICAAKQAFQVRLSSKTKEREHLRQVRTLIVCDDVMTTGASMHACMHALKQSYSLQIIGLCLAMD
jgi:predicted amidophosphoribosyltransferase